MASEKKISALDTKSLIELIENPENQGTPYQSQAKEELDGRNISSEETQTFVIAINEAIAYEMIMNDNISKKEMTMHKSNFLTGEEIKNIYIEQLEKYMKYKDQFRFDVWSYAVGGI